MLHKQKLPLVPQELIHALERHFKPMDIVPGFDRDELMQTVGEQRVIKMLKEHARGSFLLGDEKNL